MHQPRPEEPSEGRRLEGRPQARPCQRPSFETAARRARPPQSVRKNLPRASQGPKTRNIRLRSEAVVNRNSLQASYLEMSFYLATPSSILSHALRSRAQHGVSKDGILLRSACCHPSRRRKDAALLRIRSDVAATCNPSSGTANQFG